MKAGLMSNMFIGHAIMCSRRQYPPFADMVLLHRESPFMGKIPTILPGYGMLKSIERTMVNLPEKMESSGLTYLSKFGCHFGVKTTNLI